MAVITRRNQIIAIELRRDKVRQLMSRGYTQREIASELGGLSIGLINRDVNYIKRHARESLAHYINKTLPEEMELTLTRLNYIIRGLHKDIEDQNASKRDKYSAIQLIKDCSELRLEILGAGVLTNQLNSIDSNKARGLTQQTNQLIIDHTNEQSGADSCAKQAQQSNKAKQQSRRRQQQQ